MELKQQLKLSQQLVMTPQLQQAIKLLQMSRMELVETVHQEMLENPVLEDQRELAGEASAPNGEGAEGVAPERQPTLDDEKEAASTSEVEKKASEIDWDRYLENHAMQGPMPGGSARGQEELPSYEGTLTKAEDLVDHLEWQIRMSDLVGDERRFAVLVVGNLDENGYLTIDGLEPSEVVPKLAAEAEIDAEDAAEVLEIIQDRKSVV